LIKQGSKHDWGTHGDRAIHPPTALEAVANVKAAEESTAAMASAADAGTGASLGKIQPPTPIDIGHVY